MSDRIVRIQKAVEKMHGVKAVHSGSVPVALTFQGEPVWNGVVSVFLIDGHPKARRAFAWEIPTEPPDYVAVLDVPPVKDPDTAVKAYIASLGRK